MKAKEESEKVGLKLNIQKTKIMASGPIISWQIDGETMETVTDFILLTWESLVGKTRGKIMDPLLHAADCVTLLLPLWRKAQVHARIRDED